MRTILEPMLSAVFPAVCPGCHRPAEPVCATCLASVRPAPRRAPPLGLDALVAAFTYEGAVRELIARAKYRDRHASLRWLAARMVEAHDVSRPDGTAPPGASRDADGDRSPDSAPTLVTWAPTTPTRRRARGFDQAEVLARAIAAARDWPVTATLVHARAPAQTGRSRAQRLAGAAFAVAPAAPSLVGADVLLVDDVVTTGATMRAAAMAVRSAGAVRVVGLAAARRR